VATRILEREVPVAKKDAPPEEPGGEDVISTRLFRADSAKLRQLAALMDMSAHECYRAVCSPVVDAALIAAARRRASEVESESKGRKSGG
jgi:hypothetical protein